MNVEWKFIAGGFQTYLASMMRDTAILSMLHLHHCHTDDVRMKYMVRVSHNNTK